MSRLYKHKYFLPQSDLIKFRGNTSQIDVTDTIITIVAKYPGASWKQIADLMFPVDLKMSRGYVSKRLADLVSNETLVKNEKFFYLWSDAWSHDIEKTKSVIDRLNSKGVSLEMASFLSSGIIMAGEQEIARHNHSKHDVMETIAQFPARVPELEVVPEIEEVKIEKLNDSTIEFLNNFNVEKLYDGTLKKVEDNSAAEAEAALEKEIDEHIANANPFQGMSEEDIKAEKQAAIKKIVDDRLLKIKEAEDKKLELEAEQERQRQEHEAEQMRKKQEEVELARLNEIAQREEKYKRTISGIKSATDLLGLDVEINPGQTKGEVIGTILEIKTDSVAFLITFSQDTDFIEGSIKNLFYKDNLVYKIRK